MKLIILLAAILIMPSVCFAFDEWDKAEIGMEVVYVGLTIVDWGQTLNITEDKTMHEHNPILGRHPERGHVNAMFATGFILQPIIAHILPHKWRKAWIGAGIILEAGCVGNNIHVGIRCSL